MMLDKYIRDHIDGRTTLPGTLQYYPLHAAYSRLLFFELANDLVRVR